MPLGLTSCIALGGHLGEALLGVTLHVDMMSRLLTFVKVLNLYKSEKWSYAMGSILLGICGTDSPRR